MAYLKMKVIFIHIFILIKKKKKKKKRRREKKIATTTKTIFSGILKHRHKSKIKDQKHKE
jgi:hypothetical protein